MYFLNNGESISCRVISLERDTERREIFNAQKDAHYFKRFDALTPENHKAIEIFNEKGFNLLNSRQPLPGEIGCAISHYSLLKEFVDQNDGGYILVAEDDVILEDNAFSVIERCIDLLPDNGVAILGSPHSTGGVYNFFGFDEHVAQLSLFSAHVGVARNSKYRFGNYRGEVWGTGLYLMSRKAAENYIACVQRLGNIHWVADQWEYFKGIAYLDIKLLQPSLCSFQQSSSIREISPSALGTDQEGLGIGIRGTNTKMSHLIKSKLAFRTRVKRARWVLAATFQDFASSLSKR